MLRHDGDDAGDQDGMKERENESEPVNESDEDADAESSSFRLPRLCPSRFRNSLRAPLVSFPPTAR